MVQSLVSRYQSTFHRYLVWVGASFHSEDAVPQHRMRWVTRVSGYRQATSTNSCEVPSLGRDSMAMLICGSQVRFGSLRFQRL